jgi:predicted transcriptional regulator of viral defense system
MKVLAGLGKEDRKRLSALFRATTGTISIQDASGILNVSSVNAAKMLSRWAMKGWLARARRGIYVRLPFEAGSIDVPPEDPWIIIDRLFSPCYIGGWSAAEYWGLTEQIFRTIVVMTGRKIRERSPVIRGTSLLLRTISANALFGTRAVWRGQIKVSVSDPSRTILDMLDDPGLGGGIRSTVDMLVAYLSSADKDLDLLISYAKLMRNGAVFKRLGYMLERFAPGQQKAIGDCRMLLTKGNAKLDPSLKSDRLVTRWRLWIPESWAKEK